MRARRINGLRPVEGAYYQVRYRIDGATWELTGQYLGWSPMMARHTFSLRPLAGDLHLDHEQIASCDPAQAEEPELPRKV